MRLANRRFVQRLMNGAAFTAMAVAAAPAIAAAAQFDIPAQPLGSALTAFSVQSDRTVIATPKLTNSRTSVGFSGESDPDTALRKLLEGAGLTYRLDGAAYLIVEVVAPRGVVRAQVIAPAETVSGSAVEGLVVTAQKRRESIQDVPIAISAFTQDQLTLSQIAGGPDLMTQVPNLTFTKTNFSGSSIQIRGIGTQAISATVDPAVAVAFNNTSFVRNRFFEQEFYDLERIEVLRGPQGTLYGRNATAGVVNILSAKPSFEFETKGSLDLGNYNSRRFEGMVNMPLVEDKAALRLAGAWTTRDGYTTNQLTGQPIDGRDLWSTRLSMRIEPSDTFRADIIWEHFEENDDRLRSGKQLCKKHVPTKIGDVIVTDDPLNGSAGSVQNTYSQGCLPVSMYSDEAFQTPNGYALPYYAPLAQISLPIPSGVDPYVSATQSRDLRVIESSQDPVYKARTDIAELQLEWDVTSNLTIASETAYSTDFLFSAQDFNRFNTKPGAFNQTAWREGVLVDGVFCDPQLGCSDRLVLGDLSKAESRHFSQELRVSSDFEGPFNFSAGANFLRYDTEDKYYVFVNALSLWSALGSSTNDGDAYDVQIIPYVGGVSDNHECLEDRRPGNPEEEQGFLGCIYIDPNPIESLNDLGHNYFLSRNPYKLISYAVFGEIYYDITSNVKLTAGLRWTEDKKRAPRIPSWLIVGGSKHGYPVMETVSQDWKEPTGRLAIDWKPDLAFTDDTLFYASYAHGYKAGGMNPPPAVLALYGGMSGLLESLIQPKTFDAEFVDAFEVGTKNTLLDGALTLNTNAFYYDYRGYQLSQIINRSAVTQNFDATVWGVELEADWHPLENLKLGLKGGFEDTRVANGEQAIDIMDRTAGNPDWVVARPFPTVPSNCILPTWFASFNGAIRVPHEYGGNPSPCENAYIGHVDPFTLLPYVPNPTEAYNGSIATLYPEWIGYPGFDPASAPNNGEGFYKDLGGNALPNAPKFTGTLSVDYTVPLPDEWLVTLHSDFYYQSEAWTRIFNMDGYDKLKAYTNLNLAAVFQNESSGWNIMAYVKNVMDRDSITGAFLNSDDTGLTTNVFLTEPRLYGVRITKQWIGTPFWQGTEPHDPSKPYLFTLELGGGVQKQDAANEPYAPVFSDSFSAALNPAARQDRDLDWGDGRDIALTYRPQGGPWSVSASARFGKVNGQSTTLDEELGASGYVLDIGNPHPLNFLAKKYDYVTTTTRDNEEHAIVDFMLGRDVGLGGSADRDTSIIKAGLRYGYFQSSSETSVSGIPDYYLAPENITKYDMTHTQYDAVAHVQRSFIGVGPVVAWEASKTLRDFDQAGHLNIDWEIGAGVLLGKQKAAGHDEGNATYFLDPPGTGTLGLATREALTPRNFKRSESVTVPTAGGSLGLSYSIDRLKIGGGYRWERYFDVLDGGGFDAPKDSDRTIEGPYVKVAIGFGG